MKKILMNFTGRTAGSPPYAYGMAKGLMDNGAEVSAILSSGNCMLDDFKKLPFKRLKIIDTYHDKWSFVYQTFNFLVCGRQKLRGSFSQSEYDFIYCPMYTYWSNWINRIFPDIPLYVTLHDPKPHSGESFVNRLFARACEKETRRAAKVIVLSRVFREPVAQHYDKRLEDVIVVPHGIFANYRVMTPSASSYDGNKINFVFFGRIEAYKGIHVLLRAYKKLEQKYADRITLTIAGNGDFSPYREAFNQLRTATLINRYIDDTEVAGLFRGETVVTVLPYLDATQSGVVNIAMQENSLLIATNTGGLAEQLGDGMYGVLVPPSDSKKLFETMEHVVLHYHNYDGMRQAAHESLKRLSWAYLAKKILEA